MKRGAVIVISLGAFAAGIAVGVFVAWRVNESSSAHALATAGAAGAGVKVFVLEHVRLGNGTRAASLLETSLDSDLVTIGLTPQSATDPTIRGIVRRVAQYRTDNPHKSGDAIVDDAVSAVLFPSGSQK
jgi:hypothetical protein